MARRASELISKNKLENMVNILKGVAHPVRLQIVNILMNSEFSVGELARIIGTKQSLTSQQLSIMKFSGLVKSRRNGTTVYYFLANESVKRIVKSIIAEI